MPSRSFRTERITAAVTICLLAIAGCGDNGTGPTPPENFDPVGGTWSWSVTNATNGTSSTCSVTGVTITFTRNGEALTGHRFSAGGGNIQCTHFGNPSTASYTTNSNFTDLTLDGNSISFDWATSTGTWEMSGTATSSNIMSGTATIRLSTTFGAIVLNGPWQANRN